MTVTEAAKILQLTHGGVLYLIRAKRLRATLKRSGDRVWDIKPADLGRIRYGKRGRKPK